MAEPVTVAKREEVLEREAYSAHVFPFVFLLLQMIVVATFFQTKGLFTPHFIADSQSYISFPVGSLSAAFIHKRTPAYPVFYRIVHLLPISVPSAQFFVYCAAIILFYFALCRLIKSKWRCAILAGLLLYSNILMNHVSEVGTDCLAAAVGIIIVGLLLLRQATRKMVLSTLLIGIASCLAWLVRPAYLFLIVFIPASGVCLFIVCQKTKVFHSWKRACFQEFIVLFAASAAPLLGYSFLRYCVVGHFGVVSFGGYNIIGIAGQLLEENDIKILTPDIQPLAKSALTKQKEFDSLQPTIDENGSITYMSIENNYNITVHQIFIPAATELYEDDVPEINLKTKQLAFQIILIHKVQYLEWLYRASLRALNKIAIDFLSNKVNRIVLFILTTMTLVNILFQTNRLSISFSTNMLFLIAFYYYLFGMTLVILVEPPIGRYTNAANLFIPLVVGSMLIDQWESFRNRSEFRLEVRGEER